MAIQALRHDVEDRKITVDDYRTIWRRSGESYIPLGAHFPPEIKPEQKESPIPDDSYPDRQRAIENLIESYSKPQTKNVVKARVQEKKKSVEDVIRSHPRSRIISVTDLRFEEKRVVSPLTSMRLIVGNPSWSDIEDELKARNFYTSPEAKRIIGLNKDRIVGLQEIELYLFKVHDISPEKISSPANFFSQAEFYGYGQCPMEIGPYSRLAIQVQNPGDEFCIGMEPIEDSFGNPAMFSIKQTGQYEGTYRGLGVVKADSSYRGGFSPESRIFLRKI